MSNPSTLATIRATIGVMPILPAAKQRELIATAQNPRLPHSERQRATEQLVQTNLPLVFSLACRLNWVNLPIEDLVSEGILGLLKAIEKFDLARPVALSTYATLWIRQKIQRYIVDNRATVRVPEGQHGPYNSLQRVIGKLRATLLDEPTLDEIAEAAGLTIAEVQLTQALFPVYASLERESNRGQDTFARGTRLKDKVPDPETHTDALHMSRAVKALLTGMSPQERTILLMRSGMAEVDGEIVDWTEGYTLDEVGQHYGVTRERIRQIEQSANGKLRATLAGRNARLFRPPTDFATPGCSGKSVASEGAPSSKPTGAANPCPGNVPLDEVTA